MDGKAGGGERGTGLVMTYLPGNHEAEIRLGRGGPKVASIVDGYAPIHSMADAMDPRRRKLRALVFPCPHGQERGGFDGTDAEQERRFGAHGTRMFENDAEALAAAGALLAEVAAADAARRAAGQ